MFPAWSKVSSPWGYAPSLPPAKRYSTLSVQGDSAEAGLDAGGRKRKTVPQPNEEQPFPPTEEVVPYSVPSLATITLPAGQHRHYRP